MLKNRATLLLDIYELQVSIKEIVTPILENHIKTGVDLDSFTHWLLCDEIENIFLLTVKTHHRGHWPFKQIRDEFKDAFRAYQGRTFESVFTHYIRVPNLYDDASEIEVIIRFDVLILAYYTDRWSNNYTPLLSRLYLPL